MTVMLNVFGRSIPYRVFGPDIQHGVSCFPHISGRHHFKISVKCKLPWFKTRVRPLDGSVCRQPLFQDLNFIQSLLNVGDLVLVVPWLANARPEHGGVGMGKRMFMTRPALRKTVSGPAAIVAEYARRGAFLILIMPKRAIVARGRLSGVHILSRWTRGTWSILAVFFGRAFKTWTT